MKRNIAKIHPAFCLLLASASLLMISSCKTKPQKPTGPVSMAIRNGSITNPAAVNVKVSLNNRAVYVFEGNEPRFIAAVAIGTPSHPTPVGSWKVQSKEAHKRSSGYGFFVKGDQVVPGKRSNMPSGYRYVGYPLPYWVYFAKDCGFHAGAVWPEPRTHGCLRLHKSIAKEFFNMVKVGVPVRIAHSLPEDATIGKNVPRPTDYAHPDSPPSTLITDAPFTQINSTYF